MTSSEQQQTASVRANRDGHPCPAWCVADHDKELIPGSFSSAHCSGYVLAAYSTVAAVLGASGHGPEAQISTPGLDGGSIFLDPQRARYLAAMVEGLATASPEQHRDLAAAIRAAAAVAEADGA